MHQCYPALFRCYADMLLRPFGLRMSPPESPRSRRPALGLAAAAAVVAAVVGGASAPAADPDGRDKALASSLAERGLVPDANSVVWLDKPPFGVVEAASKRVVAMLRAAPGEQEPNDIYLVTATLSPEGVLLSVGGEHNLTETSAVDEQAPVGAVNWVAFAERSMLGDAQPNTVRLLQLSPSASKERDEWSTTERMQGALTRLQQTGRLAGVQRFAYTMQTPPKSLSLAVQDGMLVVRADERRAVVDPQQPQQVPEWLSVEAAPERRPGNFITWSVDRVRTVVGDETMQYVKAIAFSALDVARSSKEAVTDDTGEDDIAEDLGQEALEPAKRAIPVDPQIGFPPPPLKPWLRKALPGEGKWNAKNEDPFIHTPAGLAADVHHHLHPQRQTPPCDPGLHRPLGSTFGAAQHDGWAGGAEECDGRHRTRTGAARTDCIAPRGRRDECWFSSASR